MNKGFIFDRSGTLSNNFHSFCQVVEKMLTKFGRPTITEDEVRRTFVTPHMKFWNTYLPDLSYDEQSQLYEKYIHEADEPSLYPGIFENITWLHQHGWKVFVLSADPHSKLLPEIDKSGLASLFTKVIGKGYNRGEEMLSLIDEFDLDKNLTFSVGDTAGEIEAGQFAGIKTIGVTWGFQNREGLALSNPIIGSTTSVNGKK